MIVYNVTVNIDGDSHEDWLKWMKEKHIPDVMNTGCFLESKLCRVLSEEDTGFTYSIQYSCENMDTYNRYRAEFAAAMQREHTERYKDKFVAFRTLLEVIS